MSYEKIYLLIFHAWLLAAYFTQGHAWGALLMAFVALGAVVVSRRRRARKLANRALDVARDFKFKDPRWPHA